MPSRGPQRTKTHDAPIVSGWTDTIYRWLFLILILKFPFCTSWSCVGQGYRGDRQGQHVLRRWGLATPWQRRLVNHWYLILPTWLEVYQQFYMSWTTFEPLVGLPLISSAKKVAVQQRKSLRRRIFDQGHGRLNKDNVDFASHVFSGWCFSSCPLQPATPLIRWWIIVIPLKIAKVQTHPYHDLGSSQVIVCIHNPEQNSVQPRNWVCNKPIGYRVLQENDIPHFYSCLFSFFFHDFIVWENTSHMYLYIYIHYIMYYI